MSLGESAKEPNRPRTIRSHSILATVPIAIAGSIAVTLNLLTPAQATADDADRAPEKSDTTRPHNTIRNETASPSNALSPARTETTAAPANYRVQSGDTITSIATRFGLSTASVLARNGLSEKSLIFPGQLLALSTPAQSDPSTTSDATTYTVVRGDTISGIAARFGLHTSAVLKANDLTSTSVIYPDQRITIPEKTTNATPTPVATPIVNAPAPAPALSAHAGQIVALTDEMRANAQLIIRIGRQEGVPAQGIVIALAAAAQESGLRNLHYGDHDSLGLFQQRPSTGWGTAERVLDPTWATLAFYGGQGNPNAGNTRGLLDIPGWSTMSVAQAAQAVQISAYPEAYAAWETSARVWLAELG